MPVTFRNYSGEKLYAHSDYLKIRSFLKSLNQTKLQSINFPWGRWEWMIGHSCLNDRYLSKIGLWESDGEIVAMVTYESELGDGYFCVDERFTFLKEEMLRYALKHLHNNGKFRALIDNNDREFQRIAEREGQIFQIMGDFFASRIENRPAGDCRKHRNAHQRHQQVREDQPGLQRGNKLHIRFVQR